MLNLAGGLVARGHFVDLLLSQAEGPYMDQIPPGIRVVELHRRRLNTLRTLSGFPRLVRYLRLERPDALLSALNANYSALWARRLCGIPKRLVISEHNTFSIAYGQLPKWCRMLASELTRQFYPWADEIVAVSHGVADDLARSTGIPRHRVRVIYNPIVTPELETKRRDIVSHPWLESGTVPVVLAIGRLTAQKDLGTLIRAFARLRQVRPVRLLILGEGEGRPVLEALIRELHLEEDVDLPGFTANPFPYLTKAALFVLSSRWEGLPTVLVEALYCGTPIVATDCPSGPREILKDGEYGRLVPVGDVAFLAGAMEVALAEKPCQPKPASWQPFERETVINQYLNVLTPPPRTPSYHGKSVELGSRQNNA